VRRPAPATAIALVALFFSLVGVGLAASKYVITSTSQIAPNVRAQLSEAIPSGPRITPAQLADQRSFELYEAKQAQTETAQCFADHVPDAKCVVPRIAPIGSAPVSCGSGGCFEGDGTNVPVDDVTPGESCTTKAGFAGTWQATNKNASAFACFAS
jgi:hypothetical protein